jgi:hypothetical protein
LIEVLRGLLPHPHSSSSFAFTFNILPRELQCLPFPACTFSQAIKNTKQT